MISVIAKIDKSSRARLSWIQSFAASFGIVPRPISGHIPLGTTADLTACKAALAEQGSFTVDFEKVDVLPDEKAVAALAVRGGALDVLHETLFPGDERWIPAIVLLRDDLVNLNWVRTAMTEMFQPFTAKVERIEFVDGNEIIDGMDLKGETA